MSSASWCNFLTTDDNIGIVLLIPAAIFIVPSTVTTAFRLWARKHSLGSDDWTIFIAAILTIVLNALSIVGVKHGKGRHVCCLGDDSIADIGRLVGQEHYTSALDFGHRRRFNGNKYDGAVVNVVLQRFAFIQFGCKLLSRCSLIWRALCYLFMLWSLQLSPRKKIAVGVVMALGTIAFVFAILRAASLSLGLSDTTYDYKLTGTWMTLEVNFGLIASKIGPMHALLSKRGESQASYAYGTQEHASNVQRSRPATRLHSNENDSDHSLVDAHSDGRRKWTGANAPLSNESISDDIKLERVQSASSRRSLEKSLSKW
ncbi:hypothetical protein MBLNU13_g06282t2 [Cladosporium sp. NU13]